MSDTAEDAVPADANRPAEDGFGDQDAEDAVDDGDADADRGGGKLLTDLADVLRQAGLGVTEVDGWQRRERGGQGYSRGPVGIIVHHTASPSSWDGQNDVNYLATGCDVAPMANLYLQRTGQWWVIAAGATNTNGKGGPYGPLPANSANSRVIGIEAANNGLGEAWPDVMQDSYTAGVAALAKHYSINVQNVIAHHEWAPTRKVDPAGPSRFGSINASKSWDMDQFRQEVNQKLGGQAVPVAVPPPATRTAAPTGNTYVVQPGDAWWSIAAKTLGDAAHNWTVLADANGGQDRVLHPGMVLTIPGGAPVAGATTPGAGAAAAAGPMPAFPGEAKAGDHGPIVLAWQEALIAAGVISDNPANRDSSYGDGMTKAVLKLQQSWGWSDADGKAGEHTWRKLHGGD